MTIEERKLMNTNVIQNLVLENRNKLVSIHRITSDWDENTANWDNMNDKYSERIETIYDACRSSYSDGDIEFDSVLTNGDITDLVRKWYVDTPNYGIMIKSINAIL